MSTVISFEGQKIKNLKWVIWKKASANHLAKLASLMHCLRLPKRRLLLPYLNGSSAKGAHFLPKKIATRHSKFCVIELLNYCHHHRTIHKSFPWLLKWDFQASCGKSEVQMIFPSVTRWPLENEFDPKTTKTAARGPGRGQPHIWRRCNSTQ